MRIPNGLLKDWWTLCTSLFLLLLAADRGQAQFFKVYEYGTPDAGAVEVSYWATYVPSSGEKMNFFGKNLSREELSAHSVEIEYGLSHRFTVGFYTDYLDPDGGNFEYIASKLLARYRLYDKYHLPVDIALYGEYIIPDKDYSDAEVFEFRAIIEKDIGPIRVDFNPTFEKKTSGDDVDEGVEFGYAAGIYYDNKGDGLWHTTNCHIRPGIEFYGEIGELAEAKGSNQQEHYVFPVLDLFYPRYANWAMHWNIGAGFGISDEADDTVIKSVLSFEFLF